MVTAVVVALALLVVLAAAFAGGFLPGVGRRSTPVALGAPTFVSEASVAGVDHTYLGSMDDTVGGGIAVLDCNADGRPDLFIAGGTAPAVLLRNVTDPGGTLRFAPVPSPVTDLTAVNGAYALDIDGDANPDLMVLRTGGNVLLRGLGGCAFETANQQFAFDGGRAWTTAFSATWETGAALPTLAFGNYRALDANGVATFDCPPNAIVRPEAGASRYAAPTPLTPGYCALSMLFSDWDRSGRRDLRISNDRQYYVGGSEQLWRIEAGQAPVAYTDAQGWASLQIWGMGIASYDVTGDTYPDVYLTSQADNKLQTLTSGPSQPAFRDIALRRGVTAAQPATGGDVLPSTAWHPEFQDVNNDGFVDLFVSKGNVGQQADYAQRDPSDLFLGQPDGTFTNAAAAAGLVDFSRARGAALVDLNGDGLLDLVEVNLDQPVELWRNVGLASGNGPGPGHWLGLQLVQPAPNRDAIGAWIEVKAGDQVQRRELTVGGGHLSGELGPLHFGLGPERSAQVRVQWPDGEMGPWLNVGADAYVTLRRGASAPEVAPPGG